MAAWPPDGTSNCRLLVAVLSQGRHHQVRRLCKRAGLHLHHLRRLEVGPVGLGELEPGGVRELGHEEKRALYSCCLPRLLQAQHGFRLVAGRDGGRALR